MKKELTYLFTSLLTFGAVSSGMAQVGHGGIPYSFNHNIEINVSEGKEILVKPDMVAVASEDDLNTDKNDLYRVGINIPVNLNPSNSGQWITTPNGDRIWRLAVVAEDALALAFYYSSFEIPEGGEVFIYNKNENQVIGSFTHDNAEKSIGATQMIQGEEVIIEYHANKTVNVLPQIEIYEVAYFYKGVDDFITPFDKNPGLTEKADNCEVDVACVPESVGHTDQINSVIHYTFSQSGGTYVCSAAMVNNTAQDFTPYVLTAWHCGEPTAGTSLSGWTWYFKYQKTTCSTGSANSSDPGKGNKSLSGGTVRASSGSGTLNNPPGVNQLAGSDFYLVELQTQPPNSYAAYYAGWDRLNSGSPSGVGIHHPAGSAKKISTYTTTLNSSSYNGGASGAHWSVKWSATTNGHGVTEGGSSGSPIFDDNGRIVGQLSGGSSFCTNTNGSDSYGKFYTNWDLCGTSSGAQLKPWLDPSSTGATSVDGAYKPGTPASLTKNESNSEIRVYPNPTNGIVNLTVNMDTKSDFTVELVNAMGQSIRNANYTQTMNITLEFDLSNLASGIYFVKVNSENGTAVERIILE